jgi:hypothetical protein
MGIGVRAIQGKLWFAILVVWLIGLAVGIGQIIHWDGEAVGVYMPWYGDPNEPNEIEGNEFIDNRAAEAKLARAITGTIIWGLGGIFVLYWLRRRDAQEVLERPEGTT